MLMPFEPLSEFDRITEELLAKRRVRQFPVDVYGRGNEVQIVLDLPAPIPARADPGSIDLTGEKDVLNVTATHLPPSRRRRKPDGRAGSRPVQPSSVPGREPRP
jgi:HSP20 family molecular chaperone IbpA